MIELSKNFQTYSSLNIVFKINMLMASLLACTILYSCKRILAFFVMSIIIFRKLKKVEEDEDNPPNFVVLAGKQKFSKQ